MLAKEVEARLSLIEDDKLREAMTLGCQRLRKRYGIRWPQRVNADSLRMQESCGCVVGQLAEAWSFREYQDALIAMGIYREGWAFGFDINPDVDDEDNWTYDELNAAWRLVLNAVHD